MKKLILSLLLLSGCSNRGTYECSLNDYVFVTIPNVTENEAIETAKQAQLDILPDATANDPVQCKKVKRK